MFLPECNICIQCALFYTGQKTCWHLWTSGLFLQWESWQSGLTAGSKYLTYWGYTPTEKSLLFIDSDWLWCQHDTPTDTLIYACFLVWWFWAACSSSFFPHVVQHAKLPRQRDVRELLFIKLEDNMRRQVTGENGKWKWKCLLTC